MSARDFPVNSRDMGIDSSPSLQNLDSLSYLIVGAGFFGATIAERIASELRKSVLVVDQRPHIGGNSFSDADPETNIEIHKYGSHIFHTSNEKVWNYVNRFGAFNSYQHRVLSKHRDRVYSMPINLKTINEFYGKNFNPKEAEEFIRLEIERDFTSTPKNLEEKGISLIGKPLFKAFIEGYTRKQWETDLKLLNENIITRLPVRYDYNDRYFSDKYEGIPVDGYGKLFENILNHPLISLSLNTDFFEIKDSVPKSCTVVYTGPIDRYFQYRFGKLGWRTSFFETERLECESFQGTAVMNYPDLETSFTRIHEFKYFNPERVHAKDKTIIFREYSRFSRSDDVPYYPINTEENRRIFSLYKDEANNEENVIFGGRLGNYVYIDMHQAIAMALNTFETKIRGLNA